jgi:hypothetical protein
VKRLVCAVGVAALAAVAMWPVGVLAGGGNSDAAHACQAGGYARFVAPGGGGFGSTGECASFVAHGGALVTPTPTPPPGCIPGPGVVCGGDPGL